MEEWIRILGSGTGGQGTGKKERALLEHTDRFFCLDKESRGKMHKLWAGWMFGAPIGAVGSCMRVVAGGRHDTRSLWWATVLITSVCSLSSCCFLFPLGALGGVSLILLLYVLYGCTSDSFFFCDDVGSFSFHNKPALSLAVLHLCFPYEFNLRCKLLCNFSCGRGQ